jgi:NAD(P)-dependent dehydrogenase (short-subunit alcohol dehydrogenase family)
MAEKSTMQGATVVTSFPPAVCSVTPSINEAMGPDTARWLQHDITSKNDWRDAVDIARSALGGLSVLVNNAGTVTLGSVEQLDLDAWRQGMSVNVDSVYLGVRYALPLMAKSQPGSIINISSISGLIAAHNFANYKASKAAVWMLSKSIALHCAKQGWNIRCNSLHPAFIRTPILQQLAPGMQAAEIHEKLKRQVPLGRLGEAEDVAHAIVYLASEESSFMTGAEMKLNGGISAM